MTRSRRLCIATVAAIVVTHLWADAAWGDGPANDPRDALMPLEEPPAAPPAAPLDLGGRYLHLRSRAHVKTEGGSELDIEPGYYVPEASWLMLDGKYRELENDNTRKDAENKSLREKMSGWQPGWKTLAMTLVVGFAGGVYARGKL